MMAVELPGHRYKKYDNEIIIFLINEYEIPKRKIT